MKVLFLDIDGVINTLAECGYQKCFGERIARITSRSMFRKEQKVYPFDPNALYNLYRIVEETGCKIVVSSTWRLGVKNVQEMKNWFAPGIIPDAIIDRTKSFCSTSHPELVDKRGYLQRGEEIWEWLQRHPEVTRYAVLDDDSDMDAVRGSFFQTDRYGGLDRKVANKVIDHLNYEEHVENHYRMNVAVGRFKSELNDCMDYVPKEKRDALIRYIGTVLDDWAD